MAFVKLCHRKNSKKQSIYFVRYYLPGQRETHRQFTIGNVSPRRAKEITERVRAMVIQGVDPNEFSKEDAEKNHSPSRLRLSELEDLYLQYSAISNRPKTIKGKQDAFKRFREFTGDVYADSIKPETVESWMASMKMTKTSVNIYLRSIRSMFNWGFKRELIKSNPFTNAGIKLYKVPESDPEDYFTLEEVELILKMLKEKSEDMWRLVVLALETGGRLSELMALTGKDIDLQNAQVLFRGPTTKSGQRRYVPLRHEAVEKIKQWRLKQRQRVFKWKHPTNASKNFRRLLKELNLWKTSNGTRSFHTLRHTYVSYLLMAGVNIFTVSRWLGHSSVNVTEKHYGHLIPNSVEVKLPWR
ncbi:MAG: site-specific integrase [candidate division Zixibacteria bacterium]|nr:site-specific integrase [Candidatus Tariuqbacter arcticus]